MIVPTSTDSPLLSFSDAARMCGVSPSTITTWTRPYGRRTNTLDFSKVRGRCFTSREALARFFASENGVDLPRDNSSVERLHRDFPATRPALT